MKKQAYRTLSARIKLTSDQADLLTVGGEPNVGVEHRAEEAPDARAEPDTEVELKYEEKAAAPPATVEYEAVKVRVEKIVDFFGDPKREIWRWLIGIAIMCLLVSAHGLMLRFGLLISLLITGYFAYKNPAGLMQFAILMYQVFFNWSTVIKVALVYCAALVLKNELDYLPYVFAWLPKNVPLYNPQFFLQKIAILAATVGGTVIAFKQLSPRLAPSTRANLAYCLFLLAGGGFCLLLAGIPNTTYGLAELIKGWLFASSRDAGAADAVTGSLVMNHYNIVPFELLVAATLYYAITKPLSSVAAKLAIGLESGKYKRYAKGIFETPSQSINRTVIDISVRSGHPLIKNIFQSALWFSLCYCLIFYIISHPPGAVGVMLIKWLEDSLYSALGSEAVNQNINLLANQGALNFLGSLLALWIAAPLAVTLSAFLPPTVSGQIQIKPWGIFRKRFISMLPFSRPIHLWQDVRSVSMKGKLNKKGAGKLVIRFSDGEVYKFLPSQIERGELQVLLDTIDECSPHCKIEQNVIEYRARLRAQIDENAHDEKIPAKLSQRKFNATVFKPYSPGDIVDGSLRIVRMLGSKPLSAVYLVRTEGGDLAVLKQFSIAAHSHNLEKLLNDFERECKLLETLNDQGISKVHKSFRADLCQFLLLEYVVGKDLFHLVSEGETLDESAVLEIAKDISKLLIKLHNHQPPIIHRDLTPDNLVLTPEGSIALIDFGSAHQFAEGITGTLVGKQAYIAPEQLRGKATIQSDIYSFGSTLNYLLTGREPRALTQSDPQKNGFAVSEKLSSLISRCTEYDAENRPASFEEIITYLDSEDDCVPINQPYPILKAEPEGTVSHE
ncbi:hypothetical protein BH11CYA1_BH11CYA1_10450 [soil metagenome]